ncbi:MAG TPA: alpha/beta hydrolase family protein [Agriterribacter sp.]|nr:alpha/beta hydrolase family protein [Agriterribacter sp.]
MKHFLFLLLSLCTASALHAQNSGKVIEQATVASKILSRTVNYTVYLPADYDYSQRSYPVVYLLHGYTDDNTGWLQFADINRLADRAIADGTIPPMIIVMPDADSSWYINSYDGKEKYEDFFIREFIPAVEKTYRIKAQKRFRGVAGLSMGGYGSLIYALKYPDYFAAAAPLSSGVFSDEEMVRMPDAEWDRMLGPLYGRGLKGQARLSKAWYDNSVLAIIDKKTGSELNKVRYWIDCGDDDFLAVGNSLLHIALRSKLVAHEYRVRNGAHNWGYWRSGIIDALAFIGESFRPK